MKYLLIAGHGKRPDGIFDSGATGFMTMGEHRYFRDILFPEMKKYANDDFIFHTSTNVYAHGNIVRLAQQHKADAVIEFHFDAVGNNKSSGGHVIVYKGYKPDAMDLRIRDVIKKHIGLAYPVHMGEKGISGRSDLANVNRTANGGINYRLLELGFGTNKGDAEIMMSKANAIAKDMVEAISGKAVASAPTPKPQPKPQPKPTPKTIEQLAREVIAGKYGVGTARKQALGKDYDAVQAKVNEMLGATPTPSRSGRWQFSTAVNVMQDPSTKNSAVALYKAGDTVNINRTLEANGYVWGEYIGASSGKKRYVALQPIGGSAYGKWI